MKKDDKLIYAFLNRLPQNLVSRSFGMLSDIEFPQPIQTVVNKGFASLVSIDLNECEFEPSHYASLNEFFTRKLAENVHHVEQGHRASVSAPVDGRLDQFGIIEEGTLIQAKGRDYTVRALLDSYDHAKSFDNGAFATFYLSPRDYHRVHSPVVGNISEISYIPGRLWPVKPWAVQNVDELFAVNERLVTYIETEAFGRVASVMVGATCVGRMTLSFLGGEGHSARSRSNALINSDFGTNGSFRLREDYALEPEIPIVVGDELGCFNLGSTVILLFEKPVRFDESCHVGKMVRMGNLVATTLDDED